jgi:hypothetical protein
VSGRRSSEDRSLEREEKESPAKVAPAKKKRTRVLSSSSSSGGEEIVVNINSGDEFSGSSSSRSEDETDTEIWVVNEEEEKELRMLEEQREKQKERQEALEELVRKNGLKNVLQRAEAFETAQHAAKEKSGAAKARQQERRAVAEPAVERGEKGKFCRRFYEEEDWRGGAGRSCPAGGWRGQRGGGGKCPARAAEERTHPTCGWRNLRGSGGGQVCEGGSSE